MEPMAEQRYSVPVIPTDLRREEAIHQICDALEHVDKIANDIFTRIGTRVADNHNRLKTINERVALAQAKIDTIKGSKKATKVFSGPKYPAGAEEEQYQSVYTSATNLTKPKRGSHKLQSKHPPLDDNALKDKLQYYNVEAKKSKNVGQAQAEQEGLGRLPNHLQSISSLLLFNTTENPYKKYVMLDPLGVKTKTRDTIEEKAEGPEEAPQTIVGGEELLRIKKENYFYSPGMGEVPEIAVPDFLPDLLGVADDMFYSADEGPSIAPSVPGSNMPDLPTFSPDPTLDVDLPAGPASTGNAATPPPPPPGPPAPPPPSNIPPPPPPAAAPPPPPPPPAVVAPPPPSPPPVDGPKVNGKITGAPPEVVDPGDSRSSLLDAIRKAGGASGAKLKSAKDRKIETKKKKQEEKQSGGGGGDLMGDLAAMLSMRRKGISGSGKGPNAQESNAPSTGGGSAMDRISAMIPAPPKAHRSNTAESDDWE